MVLVSNWMLRGDKIQRERRHQRPLPHLRFLPKSCLEPSTDTASLLLHLKNLSRALRLTLGVGLLSNQSLQCPHRKNASLSRSRYL